MSEYQWTGDKAGIDFAELSELYRIAPLGNKPPDALATVFGNSMFACFAYHDGALVAAGRALAGGHKKIILYANPGTEAFYARLGFLRMKTAMAIWGDPARAIASGVLSPPG